VSFPVSAARAAWGGGMYHVGGGQGRKVPYIVDLISSVSSVHVCSCRVLYLPTICSLCGGVVDIWGKYVMLCSGGQVSPE